jgi:hypothetical protein
VSPDDHYRAAERLLEEFAEGDHSESDYRNLLALAQVHATLALCLHPSVVRTAIRVVTVK